MSRSVTVWGLIHSTLRPTSGRGRYHDMFSYTTLPSMQIVSYVYSSASMNSSTLYSRSHPALSSARFISSSDSTRKVFSEPAPATGLRQTG